MADDKRRRGGHEARAAGEAFEAAVDAALRRLQQQRVIAHWKPNYPGKRGAVFVAATGADRDGTLARGGVSFALEVKSCRPGVALERRRVTDLQVAHLEAVAATGGLALLAVQFRARPPAQHVACLIPWRLVPWRTRVSASSLSLADVDHDYVCASIWALPKEFEAHAIALRVVRVLGAAS